MTAKLILSAKTTIKGNITGFETLCYVDEVPMLVSKYQDYIAEILPEEVFKMLTDLTHFNAKLHWTARRKLLLEIAGEIGTPKGFDELLGKLNGRSIDDYKKVLAGQKDRLKKDRDEINPRIDEINRGFAGYAQASTAELARTRNDLAAKITKLDGMRKDIFADEKERQTRINALNTLKGQKMSREFELKKDTSGIKNLLDEKADIEAKVAQQKQDTVNTQNEIKIQQSQIKGKQSELTGLMDTRASILAEYKRVSDAGLGIDEQVESTVCYACGRKLPESKIAEIEKKKQTAIANATKEKSEMLDKIASRGTEVKRSIDKVQAEIESIEKSLLAEQDLFKALHAETTEAVNAQIKRFAEIDKAIKNNPTTPPEKDKAWQKIIADIAKAQDEIGEPVSEQLQALDNRRTILNNELAEVNKALADVDNAKKAKARIVELGEQEKKLAQRLAEIERQLAMIGDYTQQVSALIESSVNGKFKYVKFKLFETLLNGGIEDCCEATYNGVPYSDLSTGQQIIVGIDVINVLSAHYGISVVLFIDHSESLTLPIEANSQTIELYAQKGVKKLTITKKERELSNVNV